MDSKITKKDWSWLPAHMPGVAAQLKEYRDAGEGAHVDLCWQRGVLRGEPGWLFAREGAVAIGTPFERPGGSLLAAMEQTAYRERGVLLMMAPLPMGRDLPPPVSPRARRAREIVYGEE